MQYSTPGVAGDGTAVLIKAMHDFGGRKPATEYLRRLQTNNVGPSASTGKLACKVDKSELLVVNGDVQMNYLLSARAQRDVSAVGGGFAAHQDVEATDPNARELRELMEGVEIFEPDWSDIGADLDTYTDAWKTATGS